MFSDETRLWVKAGGGGDGSVHFRREKYVPRGGPDGGDGGRGGSVYLEADASLNTLWSLRRQRHYKAAAGGRGSKQRQHGAAGPDLTIKVPVGTLVRPVDSPDPLADLAEPAQRVMVARGGRGGLGNVHFTTSTNQAPRFAQKGEPGEEQELYLELKLLADVGLVGKPNAGKSTLLSVISAARPKVASYAFTTLEPLLGIVTVDETTLVVADLPGLIEGAHRGVGLGHEFLRHVERTRLLIHVVDASGWSGSDPVADFQEINAELAAYNPELAQRPQIVAANKLDLPMAVEHVPRLAAAAAARGAPFFAISGATRQGIRPMLQAVAARLHELWQEPAPTTVILPEVSGPGLDDVSDVSRDPDGAWRVAGRSVERTVAMTDLENDEALQWLQRRFHQLGVTTALNKAGVQMGDTVRIGPAELEWASPGMMEPGILERRTAAERKLGQRSAGLME